MVGTDSSRPCSGIVRPKGRDESVPTDIRTNLLNRIIMPLARTAERGRDDGH